MVYLRNFMFFETILRLISILKLVLKSFSALLILILAVFFAFRGLILQQAIGSVNSRIKIHQYTARWDGAGFRGLRTVFVKDIYIEKNYGENEAFIDSISFQVSIPSFFLKNIRIKKLECKAISVLYRIKDSTPKNLFPKQIDSTEILGTFRDSDLAELADSAIRRLFNYTPDQTIIDRLDVRVVYSGNTSMIGLRDVRLVHGEMTAKLLLAGNDSSVEIPLAGKFDKSASIIEVHMAKQDTSLLPVPILRDKYGVAAGFDSLTFMVNLSDRKRHLVNIDGKFNLCGFVLNGERLSTRDIKIDHFRSSFLLHLGSHFVELDSVTRTDLNRIKLLLYFRVSMGSDPEIKFKLLPVSWDAGDFFTSLPPGMFTSLIGLRAEGTLHYFLDFSVNLNNPDSLFFDTKLRAEDFNITAYGTDDYRIMNGAFNHCVYERGRLVTAFMMSAENPDFIPYEQISPFLRAAVMTSEDGNFFYHSGFNPKAFRESIATNIKEKRFARGGSTISMQLVKNVFLRNNKTLARKIEEALIVWLIENKHLVSKQRMYEIYLNMIEWGPGIYGINQASRFYFNKPPAKLDLQESVYLACIVPFPKCYKYIFETNGVIKPFWGNYFNRLKELMVRKEFIAPGDTIGVRPVIRLTGPASQVFAKPHTTAADSLSIDKLVIMPSL
jgi:hypothetical protein